MIVLAATFIAGALLAPEALAQRGPRCKGNGGWGPDIRYGGLYDPKTVITNSGEAVAVERVTPLKGMCASCSFMSYSFLQRWRRR
jgi:hypothetical protein